MQYFIEEHRTGGPMAQLFVQPHHHRFPPFDQQQQPYLYYYDHRREAATAVLEHKRLLIERQLALERERERERRRAFLLRRIAQEERRQAELELNYYQWQIKRQIEEQHEQQHQQQRRLRQQAELLERQRQIELAERKRSHQQQQQQREHQERYANAISIILREILEDDEDHGMDEPEHEEQHQRQQEDYAAAVALMARHFWKDNGGNEDEEMKESQFQQEHEQEKKQELVPTTVANVASDIENSKDAFKSETVQKQQQQQREHQEHYANAISMMLRQVFEQEREDYDMEEVRPEEQYQQQQLQERYADAAALMHRRFWKDDEEMAEPQSQQEQEQEKKQDPTPTTTAKLVSDTEKRKANCKSEIDQAQQQQQQQQEDEDEEQRQGNCSETNEHIQDGDCHRKENVPFVQDKKGNENDAPHTESTESQGPDQDDRMWEQVSTSSEDEDDDVDEKHERLRLIGDQLAQLSEKHASTLPMTRLQFQDDISEVTATSADNRQFLGLEDEVMQVMLQLDSIQSGGNDAIRKERKALIRKAEKLLESMDAHKQHEWERISVHSTTSEDECNSS